MDVTPDEHDLLTRIVLGEASDDPTERAGVAWNVLNRVGKPGYADSVGGVIRQRNQYQSTQDANGPFYNSNPKDYAKAGKIVDSVLSGKTPDPTGGAPNFLAASMPQDKRPQWGRGQGQKIGKTEFFGGNPLMSDKEADEYLKQLPSAQSPQEGSSVMSQDEADEYLKGLAPAGEDSSGQTKTAGPASPPTKPIATGDQPVTAVSSGADIYRRLPDVVQKHPYLATAGAVAGIPLAMSVGSELGLGAAGGWALRNLIKFGLGAAGLDWMSEGKLHDTILRKIAGLGEGH